MQTLFRGEHPFDFTGELCVALACAFDECAPLVRRAFECLLEDLPDSPEVVGCDGADGGNVVHKRP